MDLETRLENALRKQASKARKAEREECDRCRNKCVGAASCDECGKTFRRCDGHDGEDGARRSVASHKGMQHQKDNA